MTPGFFFSSRGRSLVPTFVFPGVRPTYAKDFEKNVIILVRYRSKFTPLGTYWMSQLTAILLRKAINLRFCGVISLNFALY